MSADKIHTFNLNGITVSVVEAEEKLWFHSKSVCEVLGLDQDVISRLKALKLEFDVEVEFLSIEGHIFVDIQGLKCLMESTLTVPNEFSKWLADQFQISFY